MPCPRRPATAPPLHVLTLTVALTLTRLPRHRALLTAGCALDVWHDGGCLFSNPNPNPNPNPNQVAAVAYHLRNTGAEGFPLGSPPDVSPKPKPKPNPTPKLKPNPHLTQTLTLTPTPTPTPTRTLTANPNPDPNP